MCVDKTRMTSMHLSLSARCLFAVLLPFPYAVLLFELPGGKLGGAAAAAHTELAPVQAVLVDHDARGVYYVHLRCPSICLCLCWSAMMPVVHMFASVTQHPPWGRGFADGMCK